jgi:four helix bundle protein
MLDGVDGAGDRVRKFVGSSVRWFVGSSVQSSCGFYVRNRRLWLPGLHSCALSILISLDFNRHTKCSVNQNAPLPGIQGLAARRIELEGIRDDVKRRPALHDFKFRDNIRDAADSALRNFPEGFGRFAPWRLRTRLDHARASLLETKNELAVGVQRAYSDEDDFEAADALVDRALGALSGLQKVLAFASSKTQGPACP